MVDKIIENARKCIGMPYRYGGESFEEGGFDCSGLCYYAYKSVGIDIGRSTYDQIKQGTRITNKSDLEPGDLIFTRFSDGQPNHVALYSGNGKVIEARRTGTTVLEHSDWEWDGEARRIVNSISKDTSYEEIFYRVIVGSFKDKFNAEEMQKKLKEKGFDSFLVAYKK